MSCKISVVKAPRCRVIHRGDRRGTCSRRVARRVTPRPLAARQRLPAPWLTTLSPYPTPRRRRRAATRRLRRTLPWGNPTLVHGRRRPPTAMRRAAGRGKRKVELGQGTGTCVSGGEIGMRTRARGGATPGARAMATRTATGVAGAPQALQGKDCGSLLQPHSTWQGGAASGTHIQPSFCN